MNKNNKILDKFKLKYFKTGFFCFVLSSGRVNLTIKRAKYLLKKNYNIIVIYVIAFLPHQLIFIILYFLV